MTDAELQAMVLTKDLWEALHALPELHSNDLPEMCVHIHAIQNCILAREGFRKHMEIKNKAIPFVDANAKIEVAQDYQQKLLQAEERIRELESYIDATS